MEEILQQKSDQKKFTAALGYFLLKINVESSVSSMFSAFLLQLSLSLIDLRVLLFVFTQAWPHDLKPWPSKPALSVHGFLTQLSFSQIQQQ